MTTLTSKQRAHLRRLAHTLKPLVLVGADGLTPAVLTSVAEAFNTRELLKVKLQESAPVGVDDAATSIAEALDGVLPVQKIGRTIVLYRRHPEEPEIELPRSRA